MEPVVQSAAYVWKNETIRDEENSSIANEKRTRRSAEDDYGDAGKRSSTV